MIATHAIAVIVMEAEHAKIAKFMMSTAAAANNVMHAIVMAAITAEHAMAAAQMAPSKDVMSVLAKTKDAKAAKDVMDAIAMAAITAEHAVPMEMHLFKDVMLTLMVIMAAKDVMDVMAAIATTATTATAAVVMHMLMLMVKFRHETSKQEMLTVNAVNVMPAIKSKQSVTLFRSMVLHYFQNSA